MAITVTLLIESKCVAVQSLISKIQAPASSYLAEPSLWLDAKRERVSSCCRVLPCDGVSVLLGRRPLSETLYTHREKTLSFPDAYKVFLSETLYTHRGRTGSFQSGHA